MTRIAYFVHGRGKGHAVRSRAVIDRLRARYDVRLFCAGDAWDALGDLEGTEPVLVCAPGKHMMRSFTLRLRGDRMRFRRHAPNLVVSDGDGPSVNAARSLGIPVVAVGHGLIFRHTHLDAPLPLGKRAREIVNAASSSWPASRRVAVHFAPVRPRTPGTYVARPDLRTLVTPGQNREDFLLAYFRDNNGVVALEQLARRGHRVVLFGEPRAVPQGIELHRYDERTFADALGRCRAVVGSAGNHLPAECAMLGIPMLALHRDDDPEHEMNARLVEAAGIGVGGSFDRITPSLIQRFEAELDKPRQELAVRTMTIPPASEVVPRAIEELCRHREARTAWTTRAA
jgi:hypothetical protein